MPANNYGLGATGDLGLGDMLERQRIDDTEELRKKRLQQQMQGGFMGPAAQSLFAPSQASALGSLGGALGGMFGGMRGR